jgi:ankyrin repeat protein
MAGEERRARIESLWRASEAGDTEQMAAILDAGMHDANGGNYWQSDSDPNGWNRSPLHVAVLNGHGPAVELLLDQGAAVNATSKYGDTPLHFAINNRDVEIITALYKAGADVTIENDDGETAASLGASIGLNFD